MDNRRGSDGKRAFFYDGSEYQQKTDLALPGQIPILIQRSYNNQATFDSPLGYGWDFSFNDRLRTYSDNSVVIRTTTGIKLHFIFTGGVYVCEESPHVSLTKNPDGSFVFYASPIDFRYHYDREGRLVRIQNLNNDSLRMSYSTDLEPLIGTSPNSITPETPMVVSYNYQLQRIEQFDSADTSTGRYVDFTYNVNSGRLTAITDSTGRMISYQHDASGNLIRIDYPEELFVTYEYTDPNDPHNMTNNLRGYGTNGAVLQVTREYDIDDRMIREEYAGGMFAIDYTIPLQKTRVTRTVVNSQAAVLHTTDTFYEFNAAGYLVKTTDDESATELVRDSRNNIISRVLYTNNGSASSPNLETEVSTENTYDPENNKIESSTTLENGERIIHRYSYDHGVVTEQQSYSTTTPDRIHKTVIEYNYLDAIPTTMAKAKTLRSSAPVPVYDSIFFRYDTDDQLEEVLFDNGDTITMLYDNGLMIKNEDVNFTYDSRGNVIQIEDANSHITQYEYDDLDRNTKITNPLGEETLLTYTGWDLTRIEQGKITGQPGRITDLVYDDYGRLLQSSTDLAGSPVLQEIYSYDSDGNLLSITDQQNRTETVAYDPWGRLLSHTDADNNTTTYAYSPFGELMSIASPLGQTTTFERDKLSRLIKTTAPLGKITSFAYDELGKVTQITDAESRKFTFAYDLAGQMIWQKTPVADSTQYAYDSRGRISQKTLPGNITNLYQYNSHNQVQEVTLAANTSDSSTLRYGYDKVGNMLWYSDSSLGMEPLFNMTYDAVNRLKTKTISPINKTLQFTYTPRGKRHTLTVLDGSTELYHYSYAYDLADRLNSHTEQQQSVTRTIGFSSNNSGFLTAKTYNNGVTANFTYTNNGLLADLHYRDSDSLTIDHFQYNYDANGRLTDLTDNHGLTSFTYDVLNRLTAADYPTGSSRADEIFTYDLTDNRLTASGIPPDWSYDSGGKLTAYNSHALTYDTHGRQETETAATETATYHYDNLNRLIEAQKTGMQADYLYDYSSRRIRKTVNGVTTWYLYDGANVLAEFDQSGQLTRNYSYTPGTFDLIGITEGTVFQTILTNHLQTPQYVLDEGQSMLWQADYLSFGEALIDDDVDNNGTAFTLNQRFPGQYTDSETGLHYNWHRVYNPVTGRYISPDPIGINGGVNLFGYTGGSPMQTIDPTGLACDDPLTSESLLTRKGLLTSESLSYYDKVDKENAVFNNKAFVKWKKREDMHFTSCQDLAFYEATGGKLPTGGVKGTDKQVVGDAIDKGYDEVVINKPGKELIMDDLKGGDIIVFGAGREADIHNGTHYAIVIGDNKDTKRILQIQRFQSGGHLDIQKDIQLFFGERTIRYPGKWWKKSMEATRYRERASPNIYTNYKIYRPK